MTPTDRFNIVLFEPEIPQNTGNVARQCAVTGARLHLIEPMGFKLDSAKLKRAGLDYWDEVCVGVYESFDALRAKYPEGRFFYATTKGGTRFDRAQYALGDFLVFGKETAGLPSALLAENAEHAVRVPMRPGLRSMNLSNTVAVVLFEALRQTGYVGLN